MLYYYPRIDLDYTYFNLVKKWTIGTKIFHISHTCRGSLECGGQFPYDMHLQRTSTNLPIYVTLFDPTSLIYKVFGKLPEVIWWEPIIDGMVVKNLHKVDLEQLKMVFNLSNEKKYNHEYQTMLHVIEDVGAYLAFMVPFIFTIYECCCPKKKILKKIQQRLEIEKSLDTDEDMQLLKKIIEENNMR